MKLSLAPPTPSDAANTSDAVCTLFNVQRFSTEDGPGIRTTLFFKGCPLKCPWCHNPEGLRSDPELLWQENNCLHCDDCIRACRQEAIYSEHDGFHIHESKCQACFSCIEACPTGSRCRIGTTYSVEGLLDGVLRDRAFYQTSGGGITLSGGEPLLHHAFLRRFLPLCRAESLNIALDTSGFGPASWLEPLLDDVQLVLFDLKMLDPEKHQRIVGMPLEMVLASLDRVIARKLPIWVRTPVIPGYTADRDNIRAIARFAHTHIPTLQRFDLLSFSNLCSAKYRAQRKPFALADYPLLTSQDMDELLSIVKAEGIENAKWSGPTRVVTAQENI